MTTSTVFRRRQRRLSWSVLGTAAGAALTGALASLTTAPAAHADTDPCFVFGLICNDSTSVTGPDVFDILQQGNVQGTTIEDTDTTTIGPLTNTADYFNFQSTDPGAASSPTIFDNLGITNVFNNQFDAIYANAVYPAETAQEYSIGDDLGFGTAGTFDADLGLTAYVIDAPSGLSLEIDPFVDITAGSSTLIDWEPDFTLPL